MIPAWKIYPSSQRRSTVYLKNVVKNPFIEVGDYTVYDDFVNDPRDFERNNVLYHYPECNHDRLRIGRFCSIACGAKFIVSPGFNEEIVVWCIEHGVGVTPGCVTPTEIMQAMACGLKVVKFFPANVYGGLSAMKALSGPFGGIKFIPTGGVNDKNLAEYISAPFIHAVGGSWLCAKADIAAHNFDKITSLCKEARKTALGFEIAHVGVNAGDAEESLAVCRALDAAFGFGVKEGNSSNFAGSGVEVMKSPYLGKNGHIAVKTNSIPRAAAELAKNGFTLDEPTAKYKGEKMVAVYLKQEFGGFAVHLLQK